MAPKWDIIIRIIGIIIAKWKLSAADKLQPLVLGATAKPFLCLLKICQSGPKLAMLVLQMELYLSPIIWLFWLKLQLTQLTGRRKKTANERIKKSLAEKIHLQKKNKFFQEQL